MRGRGRETGRAGQGHLHVVLLAGVGPQQAGGGQDIARELRLSQLHAKHLQALSRLLHHQLKALDGLMR